MQRSESTFKRFVVLWLGQLVSILGSGLTAFGLGVWIYSETGKATPLALSVLFATLPHIILSPIAGLWADRYNKKWVMLFADIGAASTTVIIVFLLNSGHLLVWNIYIIVLVNSTFSVFKAPALQATIVILVPTEKLQTANGMNQITDALQTLVAPLVAGILYLVIGLKGIILIDFITFFAALGTLTFIPAVYFNGDREAQGENGEVEKNKDEKSVLSLVGKSLEGFRFIKERKGLMAMMCFFAVVNFFLNLSMVLLTPLALSFSNSAALGTIQMAGGIGMLLGSLFVTMKKSKNGLISRIYFAILFAALNLMIMGCRDSIILISLGRFLFLFAIPLANSSAIVIWQRKGPAQLQGRLYAARQMIVRSIMPLAYLTAGPLADIIFKPLMSGNNRFANIAAFLLGGGSGVAFRIIFIFSGVTLFSLTLILYGYKPLRNLESELPDMN